MWKCVYRKRRNDRKTITDMLPRLDGRGQRRYDGRNAVSVTVLPPLQAVSVVRKIVSEQFRPPVGARRQVREHPLAVLDYDLELVALKEARFSPQPLDLAVKLSLVRAPWV
jgi:hypothetical protein